MTVGINYIRRIYDKQEEKSKLFQLEQAVVKCMRGILFAMMGQSHKVKLGKGTIQRSHKKKIFVNLETYNKLALRLFLELI